LYGFLKYISASQSSFYLEKKGQSTAMQQSGEKILSEEIFLEGNDMTQTAA